MFQNANLSVRVTDDFMQAVEKNEDWTTHWVTDPKQRRPDLPGPRDHGPHGRLRLALRRPRRAVRHDDQPLAHLPEQRPHQRVSNPCSEYMFLDDTACNLASINLMKFRQAGRHVRRRALPGGLPHLLHRPGNPGRSRQLSDAATSPANSHLFRPLGLGYSNLGSLLMSAGMPYDSRRGPRRLRRGHRAAARRGQPHQRRAGRGRRPVRRLREEPRADAPRDADASRRGRGDRRRRARRTCTTPPATCGTTCSPPAAVHGFRNAQATVLAPTGTISFMMDCDTTGIEPDIALVKYKQLAGGGMLKIVNQTVPLALKTLGYDRAADRLDPGLHRRARHDRRLARPEGRAPGRVRLCVHSRATARGRSPGRPTSG